MRAATLPLVLSIVAAVHSARADDHGYGQQLDDVDDEPLAQELRVAFGEAISSCGGDGSCALSLSALTCTATVCRARDMRHSRLLVARGVAAARVREHLLDLDSAHFVAGRTAAWQIECRAGAPNEGKTVRHGQCSVLLADGDDTLMAPLRDVFGGSKIGGRWWTGRVVVSCSAHTCRASCAPGQLFHQYQDCGGDPSEFARTPAFAAVLARRAGGGAATISCGGWRDEGWDGGLVAVEGCDVTAVPPAPPVPRPWAALVRSGARWDLGDGMGGHLIVTTDNVHTVGGARVARLRWMYDGHDWADPSQHRPAQVAVAKAGIWFFDDHDDDAAISRAIATTPPAYADRPAATAPWTEVFAVPWHTAAGAAFCIGHDAVRGACAPYHCGAVCFAPSAGVVRIAGVGAPGGPGMDWTQDGWAE